MDLPNLLAKHRISQALLSREALALGYKFDQGLLSMTVRGQRRCSQRYRCGIKKALEALKVPRKEIRAIAMLNPVEV